MPRDQPVLFLAQQLPLHLWRHSPDRPTKLMPLMTAAKCRVAQFNIILVKCIFIGRNFHRVANVKWFWDYPESRRRNTTTLTHTYIQYNKPSPSTHSDKHLPKHTFNRKVGMYVWLCVFVCEVTTLNFLYDEYNFRPIARCELSLRWVFNWFDSTKQQFKETKKKTTRKQNKNPKKTEIAFWKVSFSFSFCLECVLIV